MPHPAITYVASMLGPFLSLDFGTTEALSLGTRAQAGAGDRIVLRPNDGRAGFIILQHDDLPGAKGFLSSIEISWPAGVRLGENDLTGAFGPFRVVPGLRPTLSETYLFEIRGRALVGQIVAPIRACDRDGTLELTSLIMRRFPPDPYRVEEGKAVRVIVLADLGATDLRPAPWPRPAYLWKLADIDALIGMLRPAIHLQVPNHLGFPGTTLDLTFRPDSISAFHPNAMLRRLPPTSELVNLSDGLFELRQHKVKPEKLRRQIDWKALPPEIRTEAETLLATKPARPADLIRRIDAALSVQFEAILAEPGFKAFQSAWLGLQYLAESLDTSDGSRIEVYSTPSKDLVTTFVEGVLEDELNHPGHAPPAIVVVDGSYSANPADFERLGRIAAEAARIDVPVFFGVAAAPENFEPSAWARLVSHPQSKFLIGAYPRIRLRADLADDPELIRCFRYLPSRAGRPGTAVMGSAAWALAALAARSQAERGHLADAAIGAPTPPMLRRRKRETGDPFEALPGNRRSPLNGSNPLTPLTFDAAAGRVVPEVSVRSLAWKPAPDDGAGATLVKAPILGMLRRLENQTPRSAEPFAVRQMILAAVRARIPDAEVNLDMDPTPGWPKTIRLRITPPFPVNGEVTTTLTIETTWKAK